MMLLGILDLAEAKRVRSILEERGVRLELANNPDNCQTGNCGPKKVEVFVSENDLPKVKEFLREEQLRSLAGLEVDPDRELPVFDSEKETAICPACSTEFSTKLTECPDCGLGFGAA